MPNIKNQVKRVLTNAKKEAHNKQEKTALKTSIRKVNLLVEQGAKDEAVQAFNQANKLLDKSITSNIHHKNYVARQKSKLAQKINSLN